MIPNIIKYVSIDKLVRFEKWTNPNARPEPMLTRTGILPINSTFNIDPFVPSAPSIQAVRRCYEHRDEYVNPVSGLVIWEYRERP